MLAMLLKNNTRTHGRSHGRARVGAHSPGKSKQLFFHVGGLFFLYGGPFLHVGGFFSLWEPFSRCGGLFFLLTGVPFLGLPSENICWLPCIDYVDI